MCPTPTSRIAGFVACCLIAVSACGCAYLHQQPQVEQLEFVAPVTTPQNVFVSPHFFARTPSRVAIVLPHNRIENFLEQDVFGQQLATELGNAGVAEAIVATGPYYCRSNTIETGTINAYELVAVSKAHSADAVLYVDVTSISPYSPLAASVNLVLVDARESVVLMTVSHRWDLNDRTTAASFQAHRCKVTGQDGFASDIYAESPTTLLEFMAADLARYISTVR